jgi:GNAT superfamily N-acetyltransferase
MKAARGDEWTPGEELDFAYMNYSFTAPMVGPKDREPEELLVFVEGTIQCRYITRKAKDVGAVRWIWLDWERAKRSGSSVYDILDSDEASAEYLDLLDFDNDVLDSSVARQFGIEQEIASLLIGDRIVVDRDYRGFGLAGRIVDDAAMLFWSAPLIVIKPYPLQLERNTGHIEHLHRPETGLDAFPSEPRVAKKRLRKYYEGLGFQEIKNTPLMGMANRYFG